LDAGANDHLCKPYDINELRARVAVGRRMLEMRHALLQAKQGLEDRVRERTAEITRLLRQKETFIHNLSHDLRTPLTPLLNLLPLVMDESEAAQRREMLELCLENARSMRQLTQRALNVSRLAAAGFALKLIELDFSPWLARVLSGWKPALAKAGLTLRTEIGEDLKLRADPAHLKQAVDELLSNALHFSKPGGTISVSAWLQPEGIVASISDTGVGLTADQQAQAFDEFYKADPSRNNRSATGLGLSIARQVIQLHGGTISLVSAGLELGATARIVLPPANSGLQGPTEPLHALPDKN
jgi:signal transduction histidine kinase